MAPSHRPPPIPIPVNVPSPSIEIQASSPELRKSPTEQVAGPGHKSNSSALRQRDGADHHLLGYDEPPFYDPNRLSPVATTFDHNSQLLAPTQAAAMALNGSLNRENTPPVIETNHNPFNFQTQIISTSPVKPNVGQRRGHRYKHSSISTQHQIFQEPPPRPPLALPRDLPIPTVKEAWKSMSKDQRRRLYWCFCHLIVACSVFLSAHGSLAMTALSHLVFFDFGSALVCMVVDVLGNFEVWKRSSIRHPFGLERAEVLAGFAMSVFLIFGGFDLVSHNLKHILEGLGEHEAHHPHVHGGPRIPAGSLDITCLVAIIATAVSAYGLKNHGRISRVMRVSYLASLPSILSNPFHFLTVSTSFLMILLPLLSIPIYTWIDGFLCGLVAVSMFGLGLRLAVAQGLMLLMSYGGRSSSANKNKDISVAEVVSEIEAESIVERVEEAQFWQVHYGLCMANLKLCVARGCDESSLSRLRARISTLIQNRLGEGYGKGTSLRWEVSLQMRTDSQ
ncbi:cation efflux family-domain-containing protein [Xylariales sp. PMI_506]|nr:cation efflux family-domain-containing protein [Xylariales sp. PMI_506]